MIELKKGDEGMAAVEYKTIILKSDIDGTLNKMAREGWRLVSAVGAPIYNEHDGRLDPLAQRLYFERPVKPPG